MKPYEAPAIVRSIDINMKAPIKIVAPGTTDEPGWVSIPLYGDDHPRTRLHRAIIQKIDEHGS